MGNFDFQKIFNDGF
jgi:hypothetical protein